MIAKSHEDVEKYFGWRNVNGIMRPQSWCRKCRKNRSGLELKIIK